MERLSDADLLVMADIRAQENQPPAAASVYPARRPGLVVLALWFGIAGSLAEVAIHLLRRYARHRFMFLSDDVVWMGPVMNTVLLLLVGGIVWLVPRLRHRSTDGWIPPFLFLSTLGVLIAYPRLHWSADSVLAAGIAYQLNRVIRRHHLTFARLVVRTTPVLVALVVILAGGLHLMQWRASRRMAWPAAPAGAPNVVLIILDTVRGLGLNGGDLVDSLMPRVGTRAGAAVRFSQAYAAASWTLPSHASMFTGQWPAVHRANWSAPLSDSFPTIAEALVRDGYATAGFVANKEYASRETGLARGFEEYHDYLISPGEFIRSSALLRLIGQSLPLRRVIGSEQSLGRKDGDEVNREALAWLGRHRDRPFFVFLNYFDAHAPYLPPSPYDSALLRLPGAEGKDPQRRFRSTWQEMLPPEPILEESRIAYAAAVGFLDSRVAALFDSLEARHLLRNTIVILTADHGEEFGEHGTIGHGHNVYRTTVQVPLMIWQPGLPPGRVSRPVTLRDIPATIMNATGLPTGIFPGHSLLELSSASDSIRSELVWVPGLPKEYGVGDGDQDSWIVDSMRVIERIGGRKESYNVYQDPFEGGSVKNR